MANPLKTQSHMDTSNPRAHDLVEATRRVGGASRVKAWGKLYLFGVVVLVALAAMACGQGTYPLDIFYEMHYQQTYKSGEPPRLLGVEGAVPVDWVPAPKSTSFNTGKHLYTVNCLQCHGAEGKGDGPVLNLMTSEYGYAPAVTADLTSTTVIDLGAAGMKPFMMSGLTVMPAFGQLLTSDEIDMVTAYVMDCLQPTSGQRPAGC